MSTSKVLPGMADCSVEFFDQDGEMKAIHQGKVIDFTELSFATIQMLKEHINQNKEVKLALHDMHPTSEFKRLEQFARCRFGGLDFEGDIKNGELQDGEYWTCSMHGNCPHEGVLCKLPKVEEERLTKVDIQLIQLLASNKTNEAIADEIGVPLGTFHLAKKWLYKKLGNIQTKQELTAVGYRLNIL
jgi:DNA-binding CsgD family transcriptional regulator